jgi:hypothetical protein
VQELTGWDVGIVVPDAWTTDYGPTYAQRLPEFQGSLMPVPVLMRGNIPLHIYRRSLRRIFAREKPDVLYVHHEPYAIATAQAALSLRGCEHTALGFYSAQNLSKRYPWPVRRAERFVYGRASVAVPGVRCTIAGDGPAAPELQRRAEALGLSGRLSWRGYVPHEEMPSFYGEIDVLAVPSVSLPTWREQFGRVVIEALACGVPVIASDSGELPALLKSTGGGWCVPEADPGALAALIERLAERPQERAAAAGAGLASVREQFDVDVVAQRFATTVEKVRFCR